MKPTILRYVYEKKKGTPNARNKGIKLAKSKKIAFIDDDCIADKDWIYQAYKSLNFYPIVIGKNYNKINSSLFSHVENIETNLFFNLGIVDKNKTILLDSKNFAVRKETLIKHKLKFDDSFSPYSIFEDVDFGFSFIIKAKKLIFINQKMKVYHYGRTNFISHIKRELNKGRGYFFFTNKYFNYFNKVNLKYKLENHYYKKIFIYLLKKLTSFRYKYIFNQFKMKVKNKKNFKSLICLLILDLILNNIGYLIEELTFKKNLTILKKRNNVK